MLVVEECSADEAMEHMVWDEDESKEIRTHAAHSELFIRVRRGQIVLAVFGAARVTALSNSAYCWVWTSVLVTHHPIAFARASRQIAGMLFERYDSIVGYSFTKRAVRWLTWLGVSYGQHDGTGYPFRMERQDG